MSAAVTKEGVEVKVGQVWRDLDVRSSGRTCVVSLVGDGAALMERIDRRPGERLVRTRVRINRMHKSAQGWEKVSDAPKESA